MTIKLKNQMRKSYLIVSLIKLNSMRDLFFFKLKNIQMFFSKFPNINKERN